VQVDHDIQKEYNRQRDYLEKTVDSLKRKLSKDMDLHKTDSMRIMQVAPLHPTPYAIHPIPYT